MGERGGGGGGGGCELTLFILCYVDYSYHLRVINQCSAFFAIVNIQRK